MPTMGVALLVIRQHQAYGQTKAQSRRQDSGHWLQASKYEPGVVDDMGTEEFFKSLVGRRYTVRGFDVYGNIELQPKRLHTVWIEPDLVALVRRRYAA